METQLCNGAYYTNPFLSKENAEFLIRNNFSCIPIFAHRLRFKKKNLSIDICNNTLTVFLRIQGQNILTDTHIGVDLSQKEFAVLMLDLNIIKAPYKEVTGTALILEVTNFQLDCEPFQN